MNDSFHSSDSVRGSAPLRFARQVTFDHPLKLQRGETLAPVTVAYETYGRLSERRDNTVLVCHALSGDSHVAKHGDDDEPGWWDIMVGPGRPIDTDRYFVICSNLLGGCRGTTGPNCINPATGRPYGADFPVVTVEDMVDLQKMLIDHLGIDRLLSVVGGSLGGHQAICWTIRYPSSVRSCVALATSPHLTSQALAFDVVGRNAIIRDPHFAGGQYYDKPDKPAVGLALARMLGHITYLSREAMAEKFHADKNKPRDVATAFENRFSVGSYLAYQGGKFVDRFDANSYITLSMAMDMFDLGQNDDAISTTLTPVKANSLVISFTSDWLFPAFQSQQIVNALVANNKPVSYCNVVSTCGHDAFLLEDDLPIYGELVRAFLHREHTGKAIAEDATRVDAAGSHPTSIFCQHRLDYTLITALVDQGASVLDLGCGTGGLLARLKARGHRRTVGVELDQHAIVTDVRRGLDVIQADLNRRLGLFGDQQFDFVLLSQTLQSIVQTEMIVDEILRIGRRAIVSFPNFAYRKIRQALADGGRSPGTDKGLLSYPWYRTPNRRFLSVLDWQEFCAERSIRIHKEIYLDTETGEQVIEDPNLNADLAIFVISR